ncbi:competence damage-inducible protein A [Bacillus sp. NRRL B-14911]|nr:competence damage-inducible protein A [Bacillus sp. NRRL B-14911]
MFDFLLDKQAEKVYSKDRFFEIDFVICNAYFSLYIKEEITSE